jgi:hypothetical protein
MDGDNERDLPVPASALDPTATNAFGPRSDLTYRTLDGLKVDDQSLRQSLLTGTVLRGAAFTKVDLSRCDLDGMRIESSTFIDCDFTNIDMRSTVVSRSQFKNCIFSSSYLVDSRFFETTLTACKFLNAVVTECSFTGCSLDSSVFTESSLTQNQFESTSFTDTPLADCTFLYSMMIACTFAPGTRMNAESIGMTYGLSLADISTFHLVYLGQAENEPPAPAELVSSLLEAYVQRHWNIGVCILRLNAGTTSTATALGDYLVALRGDSELDRPIKRDELMFFVAVLHDLAKKRELPLMSCLGVVDTLERIAAAQHAGADGDPKGPSSNGLRTASAGTFLLLQEMLSDLAEANPDFVALDGDRTVEATFTFRERPAASVAAFLNEVGAASALPLLHASTTLEVRAGSYIEIVKTTLGTLVGLQCALFLVKGCLVTLTETRARFEILTQKRLPRAYRRAALDPRQALNPNEAAILQRLVGWAAGFVGSAGPNLKDLTPPNLIAIEADTQEKPRAADEK